MPVDVPTPGAVTIRPYEHADARATWRVFHDAVHHTAIRDYTQAQVDAWAPDDVDEAGWGRARAAPHTYVACSGGEVVGFSDFTDGGLLYMLFVHPRAGGQGVARALVERVLTEAASAGHRRLHTHASLTARPAFERFGFTTDAAQIVERRGQHIRNFDMSVHLARQNR